MIEIIKLSLPIVIYIIAFLFAFFIEKKLLLYIENNLKEWRSSTLILFSIVSASLYLVGWILNNFIENSDLRHIFRNFVIFSISIYMLRSIFQILIRNIFVQYIIYILSLSIFLISIAKIILANVISNDTAKILLYLNKLLITLGFYIILSESLKLLPNKHIRKFVKLAIFSTLLIFLLIWEFEVITLSFNTLIGFILLLTLTGIYYYLINIIIPQIEGYISKFANKKDLLGLDFNIKLFLTSLYVLSIKEIVVYFLNLEKFIEFLSGKYILKNELVSISVYSILKGILTGIILFSALNILKKIIKLKLIKENKYIEGNSAEVLIFNIGILFNIMILMSVLGITWKVILPLAGTLGIGIGFGLQTIMNNYVSGFILMFSRKLKVGDIIELPSISISTLGNNAESIFGKIETIGILSTIVRTNDGVDISIPNSEFLGSPIINFSYMDPLVRLRIPIGVAYSSDPNTVRDILTSVALQIQKKVNYNSKDLPKPEVWFREMADSSLVFIVGIWINIRKNIYITSIISEFYYNSWYKLKEAGIEIPFPQNDIWFRNKLSVVVENPNLKDVSKR